MNPSDLGKRVIVQTSDGEAAGTLVGYVYREEPTVDVQVGRTVLKNLRPDDVRLAVDEEG
jgi:hypothetical protein